MFDRGLKFVYNEGKASPLAYCVGLCVGGKWRECIFVRCHSANEAFKGEAFIRCSKSVYNSVMDVLIRNKKEETDQS
jgi:hypothetical protein